MVKTGQKYQFISISAANTKIIMTAAGEGGQQQSFVFHFS